MTAATKPAISLRSRMAWYSGGIQAVWIAREPLSHLGIRGAYAAIASLQEADYALLRGDASRQQRAVVTGFLKALAPFRNEAYGSILESAIQGAFNRVDHIFADKSGHPAYGPCRGMTTIRKYSAISQILVTFTRRVLPKC